MTFGFEDAVIREAISLTKKTSRRLETPYQRGGGFNQNVISRMQEQTYLSIFSTFPVPSPTFNFAKISNSFL
jgi:hypothetical protein